MSSELAKVAQSKAGNRPQARVGGGAVALDRGAYVRLTWVPSSA